MHNYEINISREVKAPNDEHRELGALNLSFSFDGDQLAEGNRSRPTGFGYKTLINTLTSSISELSRAAAMEGMSEGEIIKDAITQLQQNLIDPDRKLPKYK